MDKFAEAERILGGPTFAKKVANQIMKSLRNGDAPKDFITGEKLGHAKIDAAKYYITQIKFRKNVNETVEKYLNEASEDKIYTADEVLKLIHADIM